jgi:hypothetical protein
MLPQQVQRIVAIAPHPLRQHESTRHGTGLQLPTQALYSLFGYPLLA